MKNYILNFTFYLVRLIMNHHEKKIFVDKNNINHRPMEACFCNGIKKIKNIYDFHLKVI